MRGILGICVLAGFAFAANQGEMTRPNSLTPKEAAEGWLLLFDGETAFGWTAQPADKLGVKDGTLRFDGAGTLDTTTVFYEYALEFQCRVTGAETHDDVRLRFAGKTVKMALPKEKNPAWNNAKLIVAGGRFKFSLSGAPGGFPGGEGDLGESALGVLGFTVANGVKLELRGLTLRPLGQKAIFNGKNLDGWKEFAGKKYVSKFSVNDKLELNVKNGPGDLQTAGKYGDFLLQLDCFSNGQYLNSGIFFRCKENEYQNGYECQIHNRFTAQPAKDYVLEEYDPKTHALLNKKTAKYTAVDFGTGAIYRRMPARKEVAKDGEWFTLTIAAHGNHFATWVNGIQVLDWLDNRPANNNPRNGFRQEPGHISIQGHDPTTDLSFRAFRIAEYPAAKKK
jgi:Domain of Unknown Function (DUF1080)